MTNKPIKYLPSEEIIHVGDFNFDAYCGASELNSLSKKSPVISDRQRGVYLYQANCLELMKLIAEKYPQGCFDMIFADPPYFLSNGGITCQSGRVASVNKGGWDKSQGIEKNHAFNTEWLKLCQQVLKPNGTIWVTGTMHVIYSIGFAMQQLGFKMLNDIIWEKPNPPPNLACRYFTHSTEIVLWAAKSIKSKHCFNYEAMKNQNDGKQMKSVWRIKPPGANEKFFGKHPTQKPIELLKRCIEASTNEGDFLLDPFAGSSTTGVAALALKRKFCGIESEVNFIELSVKRLTQHF
ncbi:MAG: site-specific DNA-methyltransferase [Giesbergeria sp.]|nr:site-specific DNA-methyltransferase [Giesbergeria sp.]